MRSEDKISAMKIAQVFVSSAALGVAILLAIWIVNYFNVELKLAALTNLSWFMNAYISVIIGFVLLMGLWQYLYPFYKKQLSYFKPLVESVEILFGLWLIVVFLDGLMIFNTNPQLDFFLKFPAQLFHGQFVILSLLVCLVKYSQFFMSASQKEEARFDEE
jgi:hypothetical protein